ncbi:hypothetical protein [Halococcus thailandensis]|uniref:Uncharacterized protein n=1 Tax=Halococcus thailandensis JCM 13552 TaxID=1227457 RepID=M0NEC6_9EURY|nr:hypothetical protein [Halococcus thailandensis]EMA56342.1 hypothetical protein C451_02904 [Halococcus thailandensis JCM 13552]
MFEIANIRRFHRTHDTKNLAQFAETPESIFRFAVAVVVFESITVDGQVLPWVSPLGGLARIGPNACLASRLQFLMKSRRSTSTMATVLGFILIDITVYPAAVPLFNRTL